VPLAVPLTSSRNPARRRAAERPGWHHEPKWDGYRCLAFRDGAEVRLKSRKAKDLGRYFPELPHQGSYVGSSPKTERFAAQLGRMQRVPAQR
jgi:ATP-dependent DNA ligase